MIYEINYDNKLKDTEEETNKKKKEENNPNSKGKSVTVVNRKEAHKNGDTNTNITATKWKNMWE